MVFELEGHQGSLLFVCVSVYPMASCSTAEKTFSGAVMLAGSVVTAFMVSQLSVYLGQINASAKVR